MNLKEAQKQISEIKARQMALDEKDIDTWHQYQKQIRKLEQETILTPWDHVELARRPDRPKAQDYIELLFDDFMELHGDRRSLDDPAMLAGIARFHGIPVTILAQSKGKTVEENLRQHFGMPQPEGYRKALRLAKQAEKFHRPVITFVDTPGAYPGKEAEEKGQAQAIAECLYTFSSIQTPVICFVLSEGGSGGALALSVADKIFMLEYAVYSVLSPEGFASILWKDGSRVKEACDFMKMTSADLLKRKVIDAIVPEPFGGAATDIHAVAEKMDQMLRQALEETLHTKVRTLVDARYEKFRRLGDGAWKMSK